MAFRHAVLGQEFERFEQTRLAPFQPGLLEQFADRGLLRRLAGLGPSAWKGEEIGSRRIAPAHEQETAFAFDDGGRGEARAALHEADLLGAVDVHRGAAENRRSDYRQFFPASQAPRHSAPSP